MSVPAPLRVGIAVMAAQHPASMRGRRRVPDGGWRPVRAAGVRGTPASGNGVRRPCPATPAWSDRCPVLEDLVGRGPPRLGLVGLAVTAHEQADDHGHHHGHAHQRQDHHHGHLATTGPRAGPVRISRRSAPHDHGRPVGDDLGEAPDPDRPNRIEMMALAPMMRAFSMSRSMACRRLLSTSLVYCFDSPPARARKPAVNPWLLHRPDHDPEGHPEAPLYRPFGELERVVIGN